MAWKYDAIQVDLIWTATSEDIVDGAGIAFGDGTGDLSIDTGSRDNESDIVDQGLRIIDGNI
jgi:hypothetical protein